MRLVWLLIGLLQSVLYCNGDCSRAILEFIPQAIRDTGEYRIRCFEKWPNKGSEKCFLHFVRKMNFDDGVLACRRVGGKILITHSYEQSELLRGWVEFSVFLNSRRIRPIWDFFLFSPFPPDYANIGCSLDNNDDKDCMVMLSSLEWCPVKCSERHSIVCEFD
ncbi:unnamed protein product [Calicophoron daubneyi]|uniref:C-type lectin domain-containing protein n=1 Tax=Calicophoron daubneyi TaxID=300641 RepID=A0AAV2TXV6_CALDB